MIPLISIIIPTYNRAHLINETLDSVLAQTYANWECIVVDDGSTDNTANVLRNYIQKDNRFQYHQRPENKNKGPNSCRNYGFELSKGDYINWFDSDDIYSETALANYLSNCTENVDAVISKVKKIDSITRESLGCNNINSEAEIEDYLVGKITYYVSGPMWKRTFLEKQKQLFDEEIRNLDDWDFNLRMIYSKPVLVKLKEPLIYYRKHKISLSNELRSNNKNEIISAFIAREKHVLLLRKNKGIESNILELFIIQQYKFHLKKALIEKNRIKYYLLCSLIKKQIRLMKFCDLILVVVIFNLYSIKNKGYFFLKYMK